MNIRKHIHQIALAIFILFNLSISNNVFAQGQNAPEASAFEPVDAADMIDLVTGDLSYVVPILNIPSPEGGYPIALSYHGGIGYDQQASWVGLGWNVNPGAINRNVLGYPDDWKHAKIKKTEFFKYTSQSINSSVGWGAWDFSIGYSADSNKTWRGETSVGFSASKSNFSARVGLSYGNKSGLNGFIGVGSSVQGIGIGIQMGSDGLVGVNVGKQLANSDTGNTSIGISLSSRGGVSVGFNSGGQSHSINFSRKGTMSSWNVGAYAYYAGFKGGLGYNKSTMTINNRSEDFVYGPLYYSEMVFDVGTGDSYESVVNREHNRDVFMDAYSQKLPQLEEDFVAFEDVYDRQKNDFTFPSYDNYTVNAQGLSGSLKPYLFENGMIVREGYDIEYSFEPSGSTTNGMWDCYGVPRFDPEALGTPYRSDRILVNYHYPNDDYKFQKGFNSYDNNGNSLNQNIHFYFENQFPSTLAINPHDFSSQNGAVNLEDYISTNHSSVTSKSYSANFVETFTNQQIEFSKQLDNDDLNNNFLEAKGYNRAQDEGYRDHGIGGYRVTTPDGKTYHYSRPVYHFEEFYRQLYPKGVNDSEVFDEYGENNGGFLEADNEEYYHEKRKEEPYATHWLLTAITGPDYIKNDNNRNYPDEGDYGYWVRFDYGKWTDGYVWRNPYDGYLDLSITKDRTAKEYSWGRKQLVYLDKIVTRSHTALFVKSIRKDNLGKNVGYDDPRGFPSHQNDKQVRYITQEPLRLDEIILLKNENYDDNNLNESTQLNSIASEGTHTVYWTSMNDLTYGVNLESQVLDSGDLAFDSSTNNYQIHQDAEKVIQFNYSYKLAQQSLNSSSTISADSGEKGRLTLNSVKTLGRKSYDYMPAYKFDYIGENIDYSECLQVEGCEKDPWGFHGENAGLWAMNKITAPTGGEIHIEYEEDEYWTEAFSRRYWTNGLEFELSHNDDSLFLTIKEDHWNDASLDDFIFTDYFHPQEPVFLDYWFCSHDEDYGGLFEGCETKAFRVDISPQGYLPHVVQDDLIVFKFDYSSVVTEDSDRSSIVNRPFANNHDNFSGTYDFELKDRGQCHDATGCGGDSWNLVYKILANRVPGSGTGGGIRVASISSTDENSNIYKTKYSYDHPIKDRTSGITSYAPIRAEKYVAYQSELPPPRVTYEYVTASDVDINNRTISSRQYHFNVLTPALDIFDENMEISNIFKASVVNNTGNGGDYIDVTRKTSSNEVLLKDNTALIGSPLEVSLLNDEGHIINTQVNDYLSLEQLDSNNYPNKPGTIQESFFNMKSIYNYYKETVHGNTHTPVYSESIDCTSEEGVDLKKRLINSSSKIVYPLVKKRTTQIANGISIYEEYDKLDPITGAFLAVKTQQADNTWTKTEITPAYTKYPNMGSKVDDITNKHMLTQEAITTTSWSTHGNTFGWETINASITTWNDNWVYRDYQGNEPNASSEKSVWRKHKTYAWKDAIHPEKGTYITTVDANNDYFNWGIGQPTSNKWQKASEITRYNHWSSPIESKDINDNYLSSKTASMETKVVASGNARFTEMFYSGAEYDIDGTYLDQEIKGSQYRSNTYKHTGEYSLKLSGSQPVFETRLKENEHAKENYKISVWALKTYNASPKRVPIDELVINIDGSSQPFNGETVIAGEWTQFNHYVYLDSAEHNISVQSNYSNSQSIYYVDDFRIHPVYTSMNSYVYDNNTDELTYILDANNMATKYVYDNAGRLCKLYKEVETNLPETNGGFKLINQYKYNYKDNPNSSSCNCCEDNSENNNFSPLVINSLKEFDKGEYQRVFEADVSGGSGDYTYQWRWLTDFDTYAFSDFGNGTYKQEVPFAAKICDTKTNTYDKIWEIELKVIDNISGDTMTKKETVQLSGCKFKVSESKWADIEISTNYSACSPLTSYTFKPFVIKPDNSGYTYLYQTFNHNTNTWSGYNTITSAKGNFCSEYFYAPSNSCKDQYSLYQTLQYRVINNASGDIYQSHILDVYLDCIDNPDQSLMLPSNALHSSHNKFGNVIEKTNTGEVISVYNINNKQ